MGQVRPALQPTPPLPWTLSGQPSFFHGNKCFCLFTPYSILQGALTSPINWVVFKNNAPDICQFCQENNGESYKTQNYYVPAPGTHAKLLFMENPESIYLTVLSESILKSALASHTYKVLVMQVTKCCVKMINAPSNLVHVQFAVFKFSVSGVYTCLKLVRYFGSTLCQRLKKKKKNQQSHNSTVTKCLKKKKKSFT